MQFTLICRDEDGTTTEKRFEGVYLDDVVSKTQDFLHGVGFVFEELQIQTYPVDNEETIFDEYDDTSKTDSIYLSEEDCEKIASYYSQYRATD